MTLNLWTSQRIPWSLGASAFKSRSDLLMFIVETMKVRQHVMLWWNDGGDDVSVDVDALCAFLLPYRS